MSTQPPTRYENFPPEQGDAHEDTPADQFSDPAPVVRQYVPRELAVIAKGHHKGFTGRIARPVDDSTADVQRASMAGTGTFQGKAATLLAELWINDSGSGLLITRILTAKPDAEIPAQAIVDELSQAF